MAKADTKTETAKKTCFVMMPISDVDGYNRGHFLEVYKYLIEPAVREAEYECTLATETSAAHMIQLDVVRKVVESDLCICDMSTNNGNVLFEYGLRQAFDRPTVLIRDERTRRLFDVNIFRDVEYQSSLRPSEVEEAHGKIVKAIGDTVQGSADQSQVFSLMKLLRLTKAALPVAADISREDAQYELMRKEMIGLNNKLDQLSRSMARGAVAAGVTGGSVAGMALNDLSELLTRKIAGSSANFRPDDLLQRKVAGPITGLADLYAPKGSSSDKTS